MVQVIPQFDPKHPEKQSGTTSTCALIEPIRPVKIINGERSTVVWAAPSPAGSAGWVPEFRHVEGAWPLKAEEREALEAWFERFARVTWPTREIIWPAVYQHVPSPVG